MVNHQSAVDQCAFVFAGNDAFERALFGDAEDDDIELAFAAEGKGGRVHDFEVFIQGFVKSNGFVACGGRVFFGSAVYTPSTLVALSITSQFISAPRNAAAVSVVKNGLPVNGENHDFAFFQILNGFRTGVSFSDLLHRQCGLYARFDAQGFKCVFECQGVHHGRHHAHVVGSGAVHAACLCRYAAENVTAADNDTDLHTHFHDFGNFADSLNNGIVIDAERI